MPLPTLHLCLATLLLKKNKDRCLGTMLVTFRSVSVVECPMYMYVGKKREREGKRPKADRLKIQSGSSAVHKNHFLPRPLLRKKQALLRS